MQEAQELKQELFRRLAAEGAAQTVSYTHLTLPTTERV